MPERVTLDLEALNRLHAGRVGELMSRVAQIAEEKRKHTWLNYQPLPTQARFKRSLAQLRAFIGANRSGKTTAGAEEAVSYAMGRHRFRTVIAPNSGWVVALDNDVLEDTLLPKFFAFLPEQYIKRFNRLKLVLELTNGSLIKFKSCESGPLKFQGADRRWIWFDEEPPYEIWKECMARTGADFPLDVWLTMTPLLGIDWTYTDIVEKQVPGKVEVFVATLDENRHIPEEERRRLHEQFEDDEEGPARLRGEYFSRAGLIYKNLREDTHYIDPFLIPGNWPWARAVDPHGRKPSAAAWAAIGPGDVHYFAQELRDPREMLFSEFVERVRELDGTKRIVRSLLDPSALQKTQITGESIQEHLEGLGLPTDLANNDLKAGWDSVRSKLSTPEGPKLYVFRTCPAIWRQMKNLQYEDWRMRRDRDPKEAQKKRDDDLADAVRYICIENLVFQESHPPDPRGVVPAGKTRYSGYR